MELLIPYSRSFGWNGTVFHLGDNITYVRKDDPYGVDYNEGFIEEIHTSGIMVGNRHGSVPLLFNHIDRLVRA